MNNRERGGGLSVLVVLPRDEVASLLRRRLGRLEDEIADQRESLVRHGRAIPRLFLIEAEYDLAVREAEATWVRSLLDELTADTLPGLTQWRRTCHETGQVSPEPGDLGHPPSETGGKQ